jgi:MFS family permease
MSAPAQPAPGEAARARGQRHAFVGAYLGWMFDGYENFATVLVASFAVNHLVGQGAAVKYPIYVGGILAVTLVSWAIGGLVSGVLADRFGRRRVLTFSILWYAVCAGLTALAPSYALLLVFRFLTGLGMGAEWGGGSTLVTETSSPRHRGLRVAFLQSGFGIGFLIATGLWQVINDGHASDWRWMYLIGIVPALLTVYIRRSASDSAMWESADEQRRLAMRSLEAGTAAAEQQQLTRSALAQLLSRADYRRRIGMVFLATVASMIGWWAVSTWIPTFAGQVLAGKVTDVSSSITLVVLAYNAAGVIGYLVNGWLADLVGRKVVIFGFFVASVVVTPLMFELPHNRGDLILWAIVNGFFTLGQMTWLALYPGELFATNVRATGMSLTFNLARIPAAIGALVSASLISGFGSIATAAIVIGCAGYGLGVLVALFLGPETRGNKLPELTVAPRLTPAGDAA